MSAPVPVEVFPPGDVIKEELEARGWSQDVLAVILGRPPRLVSEIISGKRSITPETANGLGEAFGTGPQFWMNLESAYQLANVQKHDDAIARRARLFGKAPVKELLRRGWLTGKPLVTDGQHRWVALEEAICAFYEVRDLNEEPVFAYAARTSTLGKELTPAQCAWLFRAKHLAKGIDTPKYKADRVDMLVRRLKALCGAPERVKDVSSVLTAGGIRFVVVEPLPQTRIDGACFWLDEHSPVIVLSLRFDRIDWFWHTLMHELGHVKNRHGFNSVNLDTDLVGDLVDRTATRPRAEQEADAFACEALVPQDQLSDFIARTKPMYSKHKIWAFASRIEIHPGIVVGQLQHRGEISYAHSREMLAKVRQYVTDASLTDGWGHMIGTVS